MGGTVGVASGVVAVDAHYVVKYDLAMLQLMRDFRNGGGPQIEACAAAIAHTLSHLSGKAQLNPETLRTENIRAVIVESLSRGLASNLLHCSGDEKAVSIAIDKSLVKSLVEKYNPDLKASIQ